MRAGRPVCAQGRLAFATPARYVRLSARRAVARAALANLASERRFAGPGGRARATPAPAIASLIARAA
jgi:hypothetical protein